MPERKHQYFTGQQWFEVQSTLAFKRGLPLRSKSQNPVGVKNFVAPGFNRGVPGKLKCVPQEPSIGASHYLAHDH